MIWKDRQGNTVPGDDGQDRVLEWLYGTAFGRIIVKIMIKPWISKLAGKLMDSRLSALLINGFIKKNAIDMSQYEDRKYLSFNDFFTRRVKDGARVIDYNKKHLISPCDSKLCVYPITEDSRFTVKNTKYTLASLIRDEELANRYIGGQFLLFRLTVGDYHRYGYPDDGQKSDSIRINGVFHTVNPVANDKYPIYRENTREFTCIKSKIFGDILMIEVGATMVGRIVNEKGVGDVNRGEEKGRFEFGGSTVILCLEKDRVVIDGDIIDNTKNNIETVVKYGEKIGVAVQGVQA